MTPTCSKCKTKVVFTKYENGYSVYICPKCQKEKMQLLQEWRKKTAELVNYGVPAFHIYQEFERVIEQVAERQHKSLNTPTN